MDTIKNINLIGKIKNAVATMQLQIKRAENSGSQLHRLDVEMMLTQTRRIYEFLQELETEKVESSFYEHKPMAIIIAENEPIAAPEVVLEEKNPETEILQTETHLETPEPEEPTLDQVISEETIAIKVQQADQLWDQPLPITIEPEREIEPPVEEEIKKQDKVPEQYIHVEKPLPQRTTLDLFGENIDSLADKLASQKDLSVAARMERKKIDDLRQAIGINEKFLFINELFEGNITFYNKAIDELNGFHSLNGAKTYLIELSVLHQWNNAAPAVEKITQLIERKFEREG